MSDSATAALPASDAPSFDQIYREQLGFVWRSLRSMGVPEHAVEDATHEVFVVLHRRWDDWQQDTKVSSWLYGIARGIARNARRQHVRADRKLRAVQAEPTPEPQSGAHPEQRVDRAAAARMLQDFLDSLDPPKRRAFELCAIEGLTAAEAGRCLDENPNTISTRLRRARLAFERFVDDLNGRSA